MKIFWASVCVLIALVSEQGRATMALEESKEQLEEKLYLEAVSSIEDLLMAIETHFRYAWARKAFFEAGEQVYIKELGDAHAKMQLTFDKFQLAMDHLLTTANPHILVRHIPKDQIADTALIELAKMYKTSLKSYKSNAEESYGFEIYHWLTEPENKDKTGEDAEREILPHKFIPTRFLPRLLHFLNHRYEFEDKKRRDAMTVRWKTQLIFEQGASLFADRFEELATLLPTVEKHEPSMGAHELISTIIAWREMGEILGATGLVPKDNPALEGLSTVVGTIGDYGVFSFEERGQKFSCPESKNTEMATTRTLCLMEKYMDEISALDNLAQEWVTHIRSLSEEPPTQPLN